MSQHPPSQSPSSQSPSSQSPSSEGAASGRYGMHVTLRGRSVDDAVAEVTRALGEQGFGVLTEIDLARTFKMKLDQDMRPYRILGACNPGLASRAVEADPDIGLLLPCNVVVQDAGDAGAKVSILSPRAMFREAGDDPQLADVAREAEQRLRAVRDALAADAER